MRRWLTAAIVIVLAVAMVPTTIGVQNARRAEKDKADEKTKMLMHRKLECSQKILEALVLNDLDTASKKSKELLEIRKDPVFKAFKTKDYELWSDEFSKSAQDIIKAAEDKNLEAAKLSYLGMTMTCFHCHTYTRDMKKGAE
jgi:hypothetical protein